MLSLLSPPSLQALYKLSEPKALVRCRKVDESLVREVLPDAQVRGAPAVCGGKLRPCHPRAAACRCIRMAIPPNQHPWKALSLCPPGALTRQAKYKQEFGADAPGVELDAAHWLPPPPKSGKGNSHQDDEFASWWAGGEHRSRDGDGRRMEGSAGISKGACGLWLQTTEVLS